MNVRRTIQAALTILLVGAPVARGAALWSTPQQIAGSDGLLAQHVFLGASGAAGVFAAGPIVLVPPAEPQVPVALSVRPAGGAFGPLMAFAAYAEPIAVSPSGSNEIAVAGPRGPQDYFGLEGGKPAKLRVVIAKPGSPLRRVGTGHAMATRTIAAAINNDGDAAVLYSLCRTTSCSTTSVWAIFRRHGKPFSKPVLLAGKTFTATGAVAINPAGDTLLAWDESRRGAATRSYDVRTRLRTAVGHLTTLRRAGPTDSRPQIAVTLTAHRSGTIAWFSEPVSEGSVGGTVTVSASRLMADGRIGSRVVLDRFAPPAVPNGDNAVEGARLRAILDPDGTTTVAWTGHDARYLVQAVRLPGGQQQSLSPGGENAELVDLAGDSHGDAVAVWIGGSQQAAFAGTPVPGVGVAVRIGETAPFALPELPLINTSTRSYRSAAVAIAPGPTVLLAGGSEFAGNNGNEPVIVTQRSG